MKISYNWLKRYADFNLDPEEIARLLTSSGLEVESLEKLESVKGGLKGVVTGKVVECSKHPNADKLSLTKVDIGTGRLLSIVCGAPNVTAGQIVPVAAVGTVLYSGDKPFEIKEAKIRGEFSEGMICAEDELGLGTSHEGIMVLDPETPVGMAAAEYFDVSEDYVFEIGLTPNRTDATSHTGVARDLIAVINQRNPGKRLALSWPSVDDFKADNHDLKIPVIVEDPDACPHYSGLTMTGVKIGESPAWLKNLLNAAGIRPINNIVDVTNFVLMELGQPLHAFDADKITGGKVIVRKANQGEHFITLDEVERELSNEDLMICNTEGGMCIAGVFGGAVSGVTRQTTDIFLESAHFNPRSIRKTSRYHNLQTDASFRFERGSDPDITVYALKRAALLIRELTGGEISSEITDFYPQPVEPAKVEVSWKNISRLIGKEIPQDIIKSILQDLGIAISGETPGGLRLAVPAFKADVQREADIIEEILRIYGYDYVEMPGHIRSSLSFSLKPDPERIRDLVSDMLASKGFHEIMNNSLTRSRYAEENTWLNEQEQVRLLNPLSNDLNVMRQTLLLGGLETIIYNQNRKTLDLRLFEFGRVYRFQENAKGTGHPLEKYTERESLAIWITGRQAPESWRTGDAQSDVFDMKEVIQAVLERLGFSAGQVESSQFSDELFQEGLLLQVNHTAIARIGILSRKLLKSFDIRQAVLYAEMEWDHVITLIAGNKIRYREVPKFPEVRRDLALVLEESVTFDELKDAAFHAEKQILRSVSLFDVYKGDQIGQGRKSYALSFILRDDERTLTDQVTEKAMERILRSFQEKFKATIR